MPGLISRALGLGRERRAEITTSAQLAERLKDGQRSWADVDVSERNALQVAAFFGMVRAISEDIGKLPWPVYRREGGDIRHRAIDTRWYRLLHDQPNPWQTSQQFRELLTAHALLRGNGFAFKNIVRGELRELIPIRPDRVRVEQDPVTLRLKYTVHSPTGIREYSRKEIFHLPGVSFDGVSGVSLLGLARQSLGTAIALERHGGTLFANKAQPGGVFKHPGALSERAYNRLKDDLDGTKGAEAHSTLLLEEGMDWTQVGLSNDDSQFLGSREFSIEEMARWGRMPPHKLGAMRRSTFNNIEHQDLEYHKDTMLPWMGRWDGAANMQLIGPGELFAEHLADGVLRGDSGARWNSHRIAVTNGIQTPNEIRRMNNLNPIDGGDQLFVPAFVTPIELAGQQNGTGVSSAPEEGADARDSSAAAIEELRFEMQEARRESSEAMSAVTALQDEVRGASR